MALGLWRESGGLTGILQVFLTAKATQGKSSTALVSSYGIGARKVRSEAFCSTTSRVNSRMTSSLNITGVSLEAAEDIDMHGQGSSATEVR